MSNTAEHHPTSVKGTILVFVALGVLTGGTVILSYLGLPHKTAIAIAALIALTKCTLIATFFMHLKSESKGIYAVFFTALFFVAVLLLSIIPDIGIVSTK
jgi:caa(3)-type oxidase subunit IV